METVILPERLGSKLRAKAEATGYLQTLRKFDQNASQELSEKYLAEAKELLKKDDLVQASEKFWGAAALRVKMLAAKRGLTLEQHGALWAFVSRLAKQRGEREIVRFFGEASTLHRNFYEDEMDKEAVEIMAESVEQLIARLKEE